MRRASVENRRLAAYDPATNSGNIKAVLSCFGLNRNPNQKAKLSRIARLSGLSHESTPPEIGDSARSQDFNYRFHLVLCHCSKNKTRFVVGVYKIGTVFMRRETRFRFGP